MNITKGYIIEHLFKNIISILLIALILAGAIKAGIELYGSIKKKEGLSTIMNATIMAVIVMFAVFLIHPSHIISELTHLLLIAVILTGAAKTAIMLYGSIREKDRLSIAINATILIATVLFTVFVMHPSRTVVELYHAIKGFC